MQPKHVTPYYIECFKFFTSEDPFNDEKTAKKYINSFFKFFLYCQDGTHLEGEEYDYMAKLVKHYKPEEFNVGNRIQLMDDEYGYRCYAFLNHEKDIMEAFSFSKALTAYPIYGEVVRSIIGVKDGVNVILKSPKNTTLISGDMSLKSLQKFVSVSDGLLKPWHKSLKQERGEKMDDYIGRVYEHVRIQNSIMNDFYIKEKGWKEKNKGKYAFESIYLYIADSDVKE